MTRRVLCVNLGSLTAKLTVLDVDDNDVAGRPRAPVAEADAAIEAMSSPQPFAAIGDTAFDVVAYRVVRIVPLPAADASPIDATVRAQIAAAEEFAPLHTRTVLAAIDTGIAAYPRARHIAVYDAAFHRTIPDRAAAYGLQYVDFEDGWRKAGFHGLSHGYAAARAVELVGATRAAKLVSAHLGGGASVAAIAGGRSVDTTMGFTPTDGLMMATRSGTLDAGMLLAYMRRKQLSIDEAEDVISHRSGLLGLGGSSDMREILTARDRGDVRAKLAYETYIYRVAAGIGAMIAALGGIDTLAFLGGIGEHSPVVRADATLPFAWAGAMIDDASNASPEADATISSDASRVTVLRIRTREDWMMALLARDVT